jgi:hypothetical protein
MKIKLAQYISVDLGFGWIIPANTDKTIVPIRPKGQG